MNRKKEDFIIWDTNVIAIIIGCARWVHGQIELNVRAAQIYVIIIIENYVNKQGRYRGGQISQY